MPRLCYILADPLHLCYSCSLLSFHHHRFCGYFSCIILPNLRILVPDRIVPFDQALLASSCHDFSSLSFFFFWLSCCLSSASLFSFQPIFRSEFFTWVRCINVRRPVKCEWVHSGLGGLPNVTAVLLAPKLCIMWSLLKTDYERKTEAACFLWKKG